MPRDRQLATVPELRPREFEWIRGFAQDTIGLEIREGKERLVSARLGKHVRAGGFSSFSAYFEHVQNDKTGESLRALVDALTTNHTSFHREPQHFRFLSSEVFRHLSSTPAIALWSAASATGEEAYSMLFTLLESAWRPPGAQVSVLGTDISSHAIEAARNGVYTAERMMSVPVAWKQKFFETQASGSSQVRAEYRAMTEFRRLNLIDPLPVSFRFPVIFCRNVMIYFQKQTQAALIRRLAAALEPGGYLFVGHAETLSGTDHGLRYVSPAVYRRPC